MPKDCARIDIGYICSTVLHVAPTLFCFIEQSDTIERTFIIPTLNYVTEIFPPFVKWFWFRPIEHMEYFTLFISWIVFFYCFHLSFLNMFVFVIFFLSLFIFFTFFLCISFFVPFFTFFLWFMSCHLYLLNFYYLYNFRDCSCLSVPIAFLST